MDGRIKLLEIADVLAIEEEVVECAQLTRFIAQVKFYTGIVVVERVDDGANGAA